MGKRGPKPGTKYRQRPLTVRTLSVASDGQLVAAQHFNDRLDALLQHIDCDIFPANRIEPRVIDRLRNLAEAVQSAVIDGILDYSQRGANVSPLNTSGADGGGIGSLPDVEDEDMEGDGEEERTEPSRRVHVASGGSQSARPR